MSTTTPHNALAPVAGEGLHRRGITGRGVGIAVIDSGVTAPHAFGDRLIVGPDFTADAGTDRHGRDHAGHGTHLAGIAAGEDTGVAPGSHVLSLKVVAEDGSTDVGAVIAAIDFAIANRRQLSLGVLLLAFGADQLPSGSDPLAAAIARARRAGLVPVVSAGNSGEGQLPTPAHIAEALTVGAAELVDDEWRVCDFTTTGRGRQRADLVAPGRSIVSSLAAGSAAADAPADSLVGEHHVKGTGSSQAAAVVAGAAALLLQADQSVTADDVVNILCSSALRIDDPAAGAGALDLDVALACLASGLFETPAPKKGLRPAVAGAWSGLEWASFRWSSFRWSSFRWSSFRWSSFRWSSFRWSSFRWSGLEWASFRWSSFRWSSFRWSGLEWASFRWSSFRWSSFRWSGLEWTSFRWSSFRWSGLEWTSFRWSSFRWSGLEWASFRWSSFRWSGLEWASFRWSSFRWSSFRWSGLEWASFRWSSFRWSGLEWTSFRWSGLEWS